MPKDIAFIIKFFFVLFIFLFGFVSAHLKLFPYQIVVPYVTAYAGLFSSLQVDTINADWRWHEDEGQVKGVAFANEAQIQPGHILYTSTADSSAILMDVSGLEQHRWTLDVEALWPGQEHIRAPKKVPFSYFTLRDFHAFPDGRLVAIVSMYGTTPWGAGLVMMDKDSNVLWAKQGHYYNDLHVDSDGRIYAFRHDIKEAPDGEEFEEDRRFETAYLRDMVIRLDQDGNIESEYAVIDMLRRSPFGDLLPYVTEDNRGDYTHTNALDVIEAGTQRPSFLGVGDIVISIRNLNILAAFDQQTGSIKWAARLPITMQHDIDVLPNGNFLLYDNQGHLGEEGYSRLVELDPETLGVQWQFLGTKEDPFESEFWGFQQRLGNGNTLTAVPNEGRLMEVTPNAQIVFDYYLPQRHIIDGESYNPVLTSAEKIAVDYFEFLNGARP